MQSIYAVGLSLMETRSAILPHAPEAVPALDEAVQELRQDIDDIRSYVMGLPLERLESGVATLLREVVDEVRADAALDVELDVPGEFPALATGQAEALYHLVREALTNVRKHAGASRAEVRLGYAGGITLEVRDDGCGFDAAAPLAHEHMGLRNMRSRVEALGGSLEVESSPGHGTLLRARLPAPA
jgi:two-component system nitrate/nitrite sensor histidine kinase NarX